MLNITQSQRIELLFATMQDFLAAHPVSVFEAQQVIVPSHGVGVWLRYQLASKQGISARFNTDFFGTYQWSLYKKVLGSDIPKNAPFTRQVIQWKLFCHLVQVLKKPSEHVQDCEVLAPLLATLQQHPQKPQPPQPQRKLWHLCGLIAQVFASYVLYRSDWLECWGQGRHLDIEVQLRKKEATAPDWLVARYGEMERWQQFLWHRLFAEQFTEYQNIRGRFWKVLASNEYKRNLLPKSLTIFTVLQLPPAEFNFIQQLSKYTDIQFLHYNPSQEYWADSVDPQWLKRFALKNPYAARLFDSKHPLLTSMGKQARDIFAQLAELSGNDANLSGEWVDLFPSYFPNTLLGQLQHDILHLVQPQPHSFRLRAQDQSIQIHVCHSPLRQLEVLREELITWLNADSSRQPADVVVFVPNLPEIAPLVGHVFGGGFDSGFGSKPGVTLPVHVTGVVQPDAEQLWQAMLGYFTLLSGRFSIDDFMDWLSLPDIQQCYDLTREQVGRLGEMLADAGFRRGFDAAHLRQTLASEDHDTRFTLQFALNRLMLGMVMPVPALHMGILPYANVARQDFDLIATLARMVSDLSIHRDALQHNNQPVSHWLAVLRAHFNQFFAHSINTVGGKGVQTAFFELQRSMETAESGELYLPLQFVLDEIAAILQEAPPGSIPTGKITFSRMGTLRPLPYQLVVMLNLDSGVFPARDRKNTFDLINEMQARRGDRSRQSDDEGAFLDGLLLAQQACWMFYNGFSPNDTQARQPSGILQQLIEFLANMLEIPAESSCQALNQPKTALELLVRQHSLQPFESTNFDADKPRSYAEHWFGVATGLQQPVNTQPWFNQPLQTTVQGVLKLSQIIADLKQPAKHFLKQSRVASLGRLDIASTFEPLTLSKLDEYQIRSLHQQQPDTLIEGQLQSILPVGSAAAAYWQKSQQEAQRNQKRLSQYGTATELDEQQIQVGDHVIQAVMPKQFDTGLWLSQQAVKTKGQRTLQYWLEHLAWQVKRNTSQSDVSNYHDQSLPEPKQCGERIVVLSDVSLIFAPVQAVQAQHYLSEWLATWQQAASKPWVLPPDLVLDKTHGLAFNHDRQQLEIKNISKLMEQWRDGKSFFGGFSLPASEQMDCMQHSDWQIILRGQDAVKVCAQFMQRHAVQLYGPMLNGLREEK
ncbi:MAG: exonuclease V subunit gamma [Moraxellaceae bacterium]|nr:MAG: exonuclease V subunit gamma [Moraxellaceae bacterium]